MIAWIGRAVKGFITDVLPDDNIRISDCVVAVTIIPILVLIIVVSVGYQTLFHRDV